MRTVLVVLSFFALSSSSSTTILRNTYKEAIHNPDKVALLARTAKAQLGTALGKAYYATALGFEARDSYWPSTKFNKASEAWGYFDQSIRQNPNDAEIRFLRFSFACETPSMLGMKTYLQEDINFLINHKQDLVGHGLVSTIQQYCQSCDCLSPSQKAALRF
jgi:hypothetical protein